MLKRKIKLPYYAILISAVSLFLYQFAFYNFIINNTDEGSLNGVLLLVSITIALIVANAFFFYLLLYVLRGFGRWLLVLLFNINAIALYFINTYGIIIDKTMIGNIFNTNYEESSSYFSLLLIAYVVFLGIIPSVLLFKFEMIRVKIKTFLIHISLTLVFLLGLAYVNASNWLWFDKNSKTLGGLVMPWCYVVNIIIHYNHENKKNEKEILLPNATIKNDEKSIVVLVIGESARSANFSLYGYKKKTNPLLSKIDNLKVYRADASATYTTAGVKAILDHKSTNDLYEILPNYLFRNGIEVIWRTTNWGEPPVRIKQFYDKSHFLDTCEGNICGYDDMLIDGLKSQILESDKNKIFVVLHTSASHGPTYYKKYPKPFEVFKPVCENVVLAKCSQEELINAYDNTILYTDYLLSTVIGELKTLTDYKTSMIFVSDHGESLGENNLYTHGIPISIAPKEQIEIPFLVWSSNSTTKFKESKLMSQYHVFHSVLDLLGVESPIYDETMSFVKK